MSYAASSHAHSPGEAGEIGRLILLPLGILVCVQVALAFSGGFDWTTLGDPDAYMRLNRVLALENGGSWFDPTESRIGPPHGHVQHWTRPLDLLLWLPARLIAPLVGFQTALVVVGQLISPLLLALAVFTLEWATRPLLTPQARFIACLLLLLQPAVLAYGSLGRADHHSLLLLLFVTMLGLVTRALHDSGSRRLPVLAGFVAGAALWISSESLVFIGAFMIALGLPWLAGDDRLVRVNRDHALATTLTLFAALLVERGGHNPLAAEADRLSVIHVALFGTITLFWSLILRLPQFVTGSPVHRIALALVGAGCSAFVMIALFPELHQGVLGKVDPTYARLRLSKILEIQPPVRPQWLAGGDYALAFGRFIMWGGLALLAVPYLVRRLVGAANDNRRLWYPVVFCIGVTLPLTFYQLRWGIYAQSLLVVPYAAGLAHALGRLEHRLRPDRLVLVRPLLTVVGLIWPIAAVLALPSPPPGENAASSCPLERLGPVLNEMSAEPVTILAMADVGSELLWRTHHNVLSIPNHRPQPGFAATAHSLSSAEPESARAIMTASGADWVLLCGGAPEASFVAAAARDGRLTVYDRLTGDDPPVGFRPVPLPGFEASRVRLFAVGR